MFQTVTTNAAGIATLIVMWSALVGLSVYMYMGTKLEQMRQELMGERWLRERAEKELIYIDDTFGHIIDDHIEHMTEGL